MGTTLLLRKSGDLSAGSTGTSGGDSSTHILIGATVMSGYSYDSLATGFVTVRHVFSQKRMIAIHGQYRVFH